MPAANVHVLEIIATVCFAFAVLHTFVVKKFQHLALQYKEGSVAENLFHFLGEVELVFGLWAAVYLIISYFVDSGLGVVTYLESLNFTEPAFVFVIMVICASRPIMALMLLLIEQSSRLLPMKRSIAFYFVVLVLGPLLGSIITEPAAMTVCALLLLERVYNQKISNKLKYLTLGLLFVNVSIGGTLTSFAAPPVLMVASKWNWTTEFMMTHFGWKAIVAILISTSFLTFIFRKELRQLKDDGKKKHGLPFWVGAIHLLVLAAVVASSHHLPVFVLIFLLFLGLTRVTNEYQDELKIREGLLVAFFLGGLVILGGPQRWWLEPLILQLNSTNLYFGAMALTAITDNAALTYLGSLVPSLIDSAKYALVAGSVVGGGLTVIANAPNPAGFGILNSSFGEDGISPLYLFLGALFPTAVAALCFWVL